MRVLLAAERREPETLLLARQLRAAGFQADVAEGWEAFRDGFGGEPPPDAAVVDMRLSYGDRACRWLRTAQDRARTLLVTVHGAGDDPRRPPRFTVHGEAPLVEPWTFEELAEALAAPRPERPEREEHRARFSFPTQAGREDAVAYAEELLRGTAAPAAARERMLIAFREAVDNAIRHGNLDRPGTRVWVDFYADGGRAEFAVRDEGEGFDAQLALTERMRHNPARAARTHHAEGRRGGLGLIMMRRCLDEIAFEDEGNRVRLVKYFPGGDA